MSAASQSDSLLHRRELLQASAAVFAAGAILRPSTAARAEAPMLDLPIVDTHQHMWDLDKFKLPWTKDVPALNKSFVMEDYLAATKGLNVVKTVYMEVDVDPSQQLQEAEYVSDLCARDDNPMAAAVVSGRPGEEGFRDYARRFRDHRYVKGIRRVLHVPDTKPGHCLSKQFVADVQFLGECGLSFDVCIRPAELPDAEKLIGQCPDTRFILDHCGNEPPTAKDHSAWQRDLAALAKHDRVMCKISGLIDKAAEDWKPADLAPIVLYAGEAFGPDRVMFGGDWPVCTLRASFHEWVAALDEITRDHSAEARRKLFHDNAVKFYGLT